MLDSFPELLELTCEGPAGSHRMAWWQWGRSDAPHAVVCVHGLTRQGRDFDVLARALVEAGGGTLRVVCPDIAGRGHSDWLGDPKHYAVPTYVADMLGLLANLHRRAPLVTLDWVGTSMGGLIAMGLLGTPDLPLPVPVRRLVLNDVGPVLEWTALQRIAAFVGRGTARFDSPQQAAEALSAVSAGFGPHTSEQWLALSMPMLRPLSDGGWRLHYDPSIGVPVRGLTQEVARQGEAGLWQAWDRISAPTLILRGAESDLLSAATARAMCRRGPEARLIEFPGIGHAPTLVIPQQVDPVVSFLLDGSPPHEKSAG